MNPSADLCEEIKQCKHSNISIYTYACTSVRFTDGKAKTYHFTSAVNYYSLPIIIKIYWDIA